MAHFDDATSVFKLLWVLCAMCACVGFRASHRFAHGLPRFGASTISEQTTQSSEEFAKQLTQFERVGRALRFYQSAVPIFVAYKSFSQVMKFRRDVLGHDITPEDEDKAYEALHDRGSDELVKRIKELQGFYVKTGQILSTRKDIFPEQYTEKLAMMQDALDPLPGSVIKEVVRRELLDGAELSDLFASFEDECLGSASIAQVHKAVLLDGRTVAVKVQRPAVEGKLLGDIANLKSFAKFVADALPIDYYKIFCELERTLQYELDFLHEAQATAKMAAAVAHAPNNRPRRPAVTIPLPIPGLVSRRVMVMEYIEGTPLSKIAAQMASKGIKAGSPESLLLGKRLLSSLTDAYSAMIFCSGILHRDPHPGNVFILEGGNVCLLDCGQVKQLTTPQRMGLAGLVIQVNEWVKENTALTLLSKNAAGINGAEEEKRRLQKSLDEKTKKLAETVRGFGVTFKPGAGDDCAAAVAILLFGNTETLLPGGYAGEEISPDSPIVQVTQFPQELVLLGRATVMIKGIAARLGLPWGLSDRWAAIAREALELDSPVDRLPIWSVVRPTVATPGAAAPDGRQVSGAVPIRFRDITISLRSVLGLTSSWAKGKLLRMWRSLVPTSKREWVGQAAIKIIARVAKTWG